MLTFVFLTEFGRRNLDLPFSAYPLEFDFIMNDSSFIELPEPTPPSGDQCCQHGIQIYVASEQTVPPDDDDDQVKTIVEYMRSITWEITCELCESIFGHKIAASGPVVKTCPISCLPSFYDKTVIADLSQTIASRNFGWERTYMLILLIDENTYKTPLQTLADCLEKFNNDILRTCLYRKSLTPGIGTDEHLAKVAAESRDRIRESAQGILALASSGMEHA